MTIHEDSFPTVQPLRSIETATAICMRIRRQQQEDRQRLARAQACVQPAGSRLYGTCVYTSEQRFQDMSEQWLRGSEFERLPKGIK